MRAFVLAYHEANLPAWPAFGSKCRYLFPVANEPIVRHVLRDIRAAGLTDVTLLANDHCASGMRMTLGDGRDLDIMLTHARALPQRVLGGALKQPGDGPVLVVRGDALLDEGLAEHLGTFAAGDADALLVRIHGERRGAGGDAAWMLSADAVAALRASVAPGTDTRTILEAAGLRVHEVETGGCLPCRGRSDRLLEANRRALTRLPHDARAVHHALANCEITGLVVIAPTARLESTVVRGPAIIGHGARLSSTYVGPSTAIGDNASLDGIEIEHSIVLADAVLDFVGTRLEESIIGRGAHIGRRFRMPSALRLAVGEDANVAFS